MDILLSWLKEGRGRMGKKEKEGNKRRGKNSDPHETERTNCPRK